MSNLFWFWPKFGLRFVPKTTSIIHIANPTKYSILVQLCLKMKKMLLWSSHTNLKFVFFGQNRTRLKGWIGCNKVFNFSFVAHCDLCFSQKISRCFKIRTFFYFRRILVYFKCRVAKNFFKKKVTALRRQIFRKADRWPDIPID